MTLDDTPARGEDTGGDLACTRCRERKIKCGRERPQCSNCERDKDASCIYRHPTKRVNHLKLLCDSVERLQDRLTNMESHLARSSGSHGQLAPDGLQHRLTPSRSSTDEDEEFHGSDEAAFNSDDSDLHVHRSNIDNVDRWHGPSSLYVLCNRLKANLSTDMARSGTELIDNISDAAGKSELFPAYSDQSLLQLVPKQQALTAVEHFFRHIDSTTDVFVRSNLEANLERVYAGPVQARDEAWAICFRTLVLLVLGQEVSTQLRNGSDALFGNFARTFLPSRAGLVNSRLLTTPRLVNVQTLLLLSVAAQQFDPLGWAELMFQHACMLARTMGLHQAQLLYHDDSPIEVKEKAKVLQALYCRDKSLYVHRGSISWLPSHDSLIGPQLSIAVEKPSPYPYRIRLAMIQEDIYRLDQLSSRSCSSSNRKIQVLLRRVSQGLEKYQKSFGIIQSPPPYPSGLTNLSLEFLSTRLLGLQHSHDAKDRDQVRADARASCYLLLIASGDHDPTTLEAFKSGFLNLVSKSPKRIAVPASLETSDLPFATALDVFSVPAFFVLFDEVVRQYKSRDHEYINAEMELLRKVSVCYHSNTRHMESNSYHRKVAWTFEQLLNIADQLETVNQVSGVTKTPGAPVANMTMSNTQSPLSTIQPESLEFNNTSGGPYMQNDFGQFGFQPSPDPSSNMSWESLMPFSSAFGPLTPLSNSLDMPMPLASDPFGQILGSTNHASDQSLQSALSTSSDASSSRKRRRTISGQDTAMGGVGQSPHTNGFNLPTDKAS